LTLQLFDIPSFPLQVAIVSSDCCGFAQSSLCAVTGSTTPERSPPSRSSQIPLEWPFRSTWYFLLFLIDCGFSFSFHFLVCFLCCAQILRRIPPLFWNPLVGLLADTYDRRKLMIFADISRFFVVVAILLVTRFLEGKVRSHLRSLLWL
jgi:hypothetical protein